MWPATVFMVAFTILNAMLIYVAGIYALIFTIPSQSIVVYTYLMARKFGINQNDDCEYPAGNKLFSDANNLNDALIEHPAYKNVPINIHNDRHVNILQNQYDIENNLFNK